MIALGDRVNVVRGAHVLCAVSGGADSVALLLLLDDARKAGLISLSAAHFEHGIRGEASKNDMRFVRALCERLAVPCLVESGDVPAMAKAAGKGIEEMAREARYRFLREAKETLKADFIATAHHADDQAETVLMHLFRGSGLTGVCGMRSIENILYRPLLSFGKAELVRYVKERGERFCEDETNARVDTPRNALRHTVLPAVRAIYPGYVNAVNRFSRIIQDENAYLDAEARAWMKERYREMPFGWALEIDGAQNKVILRRALHTLLPDCGYDSVSRAAALIEEDAPAIELPGGHRFERYANRLYYSRAGAKKTEIERPLTDGATLNGVGGVRVRPGGDKPVKNDLYRQTVSAAATKNACIRTRRDGDFIRPFGMRNKKKLSDYLIDKKVDRPLRDWLLLIAKGDEVLWVAGVGLSETMRFQKNEQSMEILFMGDKLLP